MLKTKTKVTIKNIADMAQTSMGTVDRIINNRGEVKDETRRNVMAIIDQMGFTPNLLAKSLASKKIYNFIAVIPTAHENAPYWYKPMEGIKKGAAELKDFNIKVEFITFEISSEKEFNKVCMQALTANPSGIVLAPVFKEAAYTFVLQLDKEKIPYVFIDIDQDRSENIAYFGQNAFQSGVVSARLFHHSIPSNSKLLILKLTNGGVISNQLYKRELGFLEYFQHIKNGNYKIEAINIDINEKGQPEKEFNNEITEQAGISGIFVPNSRIYLLADWLKNSKLNTKLFLLGYDMIEQNVEHLKIGTIDFLINQKPEEQGYKSIHCLFNHVVAGKKVEKYNSSVIEIMLKENIDYYN